MQPVHTVHIPTKYGEKAIEVYCCDILAFDEPIDVLTTSAFYREYSPTPRTLFAALQNAGISVWNLAIRPQIDLRNLCNVWLSEETGQENGNIRRIGCIEMTPFDASKIGVVSDKQGLFTSIRAYFRMLDVASACGIPTATIALPLLGAGNQHISASLTMIPLLSECISLLKRNENVKRLCFIERNEDKAEIIRMALESSYSIAQEISKAETEEAGKTKAAVQPQTARAFISYASKDKNIADNLCFKLESRGVRVWYAPRDVSGPFAEAIFKGINEATHFIVILSENSMLSEHVLNEVDLAFRKLPAKIRFKPLRIDKAMFTPSFDYYLSRQHWMDAVEPPLEARLEEFVDGLVKDL